MVCSVLFQLILRLRDSQALLRRSNEENATALKQYEEFFIWIWNFFTEDEGIFTGANFGRRCLSLECLTELVGTFGDLSIFRVKSDNLKYLSWLSDTYENNKIHASEILLKLPIPAFKVITVHEQHKHEQNLYFLFFVLFYIRRKQCVKNFSMNL